MSSFRIWGHFDDGCESRSHNRVMIKIYTNFHVIYFVFNKVIEIINLGVWEQLSILKIAFGGISQSGSRSHLIQHIKLYSCADFHAFITLCARSSF